MKMNVVHLDFDPGKIYCPFCASRVDDPDQELCGHVLFVVAQGNFDYYSETFKKEANLTGGENHFYELSLQERNEIGTPDEITSSVRSKFSNYVEFRFVEGEDVISIGLSGGED